MCAKTKESEKKIKSSKIVGKKSVEKEKVTPVDKKMTEARENDKKIKVEKDKNLKGVEADKKKTIKNVKSRKKDGKKSVVDLENENKKEKNKKKLGIKDLKKKEKNKEKKFVSVGKRKTSVARVFMQKGSGTIIINGKKLIDFSPNEFLSYKIMQPLDLIKCGKTFDIEVNVAGGGVNSQAEAIRLGIAKNLLNFNLDYKSVLKDLELLTRDPRVVERKKFGHKKARKSFQFSKR